MTSTKRSVDFAAAPLDEGDVAQCLDLSSAAGWNQTEHDWHFHLRTGEGIGLRDDLGRLIATGVVLPAGKGAGWIAMVLVSEPLRRRGLGRRIMESLISRSHFPCLALDATEQGVTLYAGLEFRPLERIVRHRLHRQGDLRGLDRLRRDAIADDLPFLGIARALTEREDVVTVGGAASIGLIRPGRLAYHLGPVAASSEEDAARFILSILDKTEGDVLVDIPSRLGTFTRRLERAGFVAERTFVRMARGGTLLVEPGIFAIAGPEYG